MVKKTSAVKIPTPLCRSRRRARSNKLTANAARPIAYQRRKVSVRSITGPQTKFQTLAETPSATIEATVATENPARVIVKGSVTVTKPLPIPVGSIKKKNVIGDERESCLTGRQRAAARAHNGREPSASGTRRWHG